MKQKCSKLTASWSVRKASLGIEEVPCTQARGGSSVHARRKFHTCIPLGAHRGSSVNMQPPGGTRGVPYGGTCAAPLGCQQTPLGGARTCSPLGHTGSSLGGVQHLERAGTSHACTSPWTCTANRARATSGALPLGERRLEQALPWERTHLSALLGMSCDHLGSAFPSSCTFGLHAPGWCPLARDVRTLGMVCAYL